jgi:hypothetical protein
LLIIFLLTACVEQEKKTVQLADSSDVTPISVSVNGESTDVYLIDLGEKLTQGPTEKISIEITNNGKFPLKDLDAEFLTPNNILKYEVDQDGYYQFPGGSGSCGNILEAGESCIVKLSFDPVKSAEFETDLVLSYRDILGQKKQSVKFKAVIGLPASLFFTSEQSSHHFGVVEKLDANTLYKTIEVQNGGELSARALTLSLEKAYGEEDVYEVVDNNCNDTLPPGSTCHYTISFTPRNNELTDPELEYSSQASLNYVKDNLGATKSISASFVAFSTSIAGKFDGAGVNLLSFSESVVGNKEVLKFKLKNNGYKNGILKNIIFYQSDDTLWATCNGETGSELICLDSDGDRMALADFPFIVKDSSSCIGTDSFGKTLTTEGKTCSFDLTYWPSVTHTSGINYDGTKIYIEYDTTFKNIENLVQKQVFSINANSLGPANLIVSSIVYDGNTEVLSNSGNEYEADLGRVTLVSSTSLTKRLTINVRNNGGTTATFTSITDGATVPNIVSDLPIDIGDYYKSVVHSNCYTLEVNGTCQINMDINPIASNQSDENSNMFDEITSDLAGEGHKFFHFYYSDGTSFMDDGSVSPSRSVQSKISSKLVRKGYLVYDDSILPSGGVLGSIVNGSNTARIFKLMIANAGTGYIPFINIRLDYGVNDETYGIKYYADAPSSADKDCYPLLYFSDSLVETDRVAPEAATVATWPAADPNKSLGAGESCELTFSLDPLVVTDGNLTRDTYVNGGRVLRLVNFAWLGIGTNSVSNWNQNFVVADNNTQDAWEYGGGDLYLALNIDYYDGDDYAGADLPVFGDFHNIENLDEDFGINLAIDSPAKLIPDLPTPIASAIFYRPEINLPALNLPDYLVDPSSSNLNTPRDPIDNPVTVPAMTSHYESNSSVTVPSALLFANESVPIILTEKDDSYEYTLHLGTFPNNGSYQGSFSFLNQGGSSATISSFDWENLSASPLTISAGSINSNTLVDPSGQVDIELSFSPTTIGTHSRILELVYDNGYRSVTKRVLIIAESISTFADLKIDVMNYDISYDPDLDIINETYNGAIVSSFNSNQLGYNKTVSGNQLQFEAVKASVVYDKKRIVITNTSATETMSNVSVNLANQDGITIENTSDGSVLSNDTCMGGDINPLDSCYIEVTFTASSSTASLASKLMVVNYEIANNQYTSRQLLLNFVGNEPANLSILSINTESVTDNSAGGLIRVSYPLDYGGYLDSNHILLDEYTKSVENGCSSCDTVVEVVNSSTLKASFLKLFNDSIGGVVPAGAEVKIYDNAATGNNNVVQIWATRACLYGDDEFDGAIPSNEKGFNALTSSPCYLKFSYEIRGQYIDSYQIDTNDNVLQLRYFNNKRNSFNSLYVHLKGFIEPNQSVIDGAEVETDYFNVEAYDDGSVAFSWPEMEEDILAWGSIVGYRVFYATNINSLSNIYTTTASYEDTLVPEIDFSSSSFGNSQFVYFRVATLRSFAGASYISETPLGALRVIIPPVGVNYLHDQSALLDSELMDSEVYYKDEAIDACSADSYEISNAGSVTSYPKELINTSMWTAVQGDASLSNYPNDISPLYYSHWLSDLPVDIEDVLGDLDLLGSYNSNELIQVFPSNSLVYKKLCTDSNSCNDLSKVVGGDGVDLYVDGLYYVDEDDFEGFTRCYKTIP